jgi:hypothetical protein
VSITSPSSSTSPLAASAWARACATKSSAALKAVLPVAVTDERLVNTDRSSSAPWYAITSSPVAWLK